jgi:type III pantothenate kinase
MNLAIDIGNTTAKYAVFEKEKLINASVFTDHYLGRLQKYLSEYPSVSSVIYCNVSSHDQAMLEYLRQYKDFIEFSAQTRMPIKIDYATPGSPGPDRLAAAIGAAQLFPCKNVLVINMGTCITFELITSKKEYKGGKISPGAQMRLKALHHFTAKLPLVSLGFYNHAVGESTNDSILAGVFNGIVYEISGTIDELNKHYEDLQTIMTGGDSPLFVKAIKKTIFTEPFLVLKGLNSVLNYHG